MKLKTCSSCVIECYLWKSTPKLCKSCALKNATSVGSFKITSKSKTIKQFSDKRLKQMAEYRKVRDKFLKENPKCQYPNCESLEVTCHHPEGRIGKKLTDSTKFKSLCWPHHKWCEENPVQAKELGLSSDRL